MDSEICGDVFDNSQYPCQPSTSFFKRTSSVLVMNSEARELQPSPKSPHSDREASLRPITPEFNSESGDRSCTFTSLALLPTAPPKAIYLDSHLNHGLSSASEEYPHTPKEGFFNSFALGPESPGRFMLAPHSRIFLQEYQTSVVRQLQFESSDSFVENPDHEADMGSNSDDMILFELVYRTLLELILSVQAEGIPAEILSLDLDSDRLKTPVSSPSLSGIGEICPCTPVKPRSRVRNIDKGLCRKLDF